jgi:hypothetical protein
MTVLASAVFSETDAIKVQAIFRSIEATAASGTRMLFLQEMAIFGALVGRYFFAVMEIQLLPEMIQCGDQRPSPR